MVQTNKLSLICTFALVLADQKEAVSCRSIGHTTSKVSFSSFLFIFFFFHYFASEMRTEERAVIITNCQ